LGGFSGSRTLGKNWGGEAAHREKSGAQVRTQDLKRRNCRWGKNCKARKKTSMESEPKTKKSDCYRRHDSRGEQGKAPQKITIEKRANTKSEEKGKKKRGIQKEKKKEIFQASKTKTRKEQATSIKKGMSAKGKGKKKVSRPNQQGPRSKKRDPPQGRSKKKHVEKFSEKECRGVPERTVSKRRGKYGQKKRCQECNRELCKRKK